MAIRGLNSEGAPDRTAFRSSSTLNVGPRFDLMLWPRLRNSGPDDAIWTGSTGLT